MRTFNSTITSMVAALAVAVSLSFTGTALAAPKFASPDKALQQGISAFNGGYYELAIPALEHAAERNMLLGQYFLGLLYADNNSVHTDHAKAYILFQTIANSYADTDPRDKTKAPYVARALTALAGYIAGGLPEIGVRANAKLAAEYLHHAAIFFDNEDAQFELSKLNLKGSDSDVLRGKNWLAILAKKGHAGAQAFLADLYWRGLHMRKDPVRALALISVAVKNAPPKDRVWIEDIYQNIYCGASLGVRARVDGSMVAEWDSRYGRKPSYEDRLGLGILDVRTHRVCKDGQSPPLLEQRDGAIAADATEPMTAGGGTTAPVPPSAHGFMQGGGMTGGLRGVGETKIEPATP